jgi:hypothetical protein
MLWQRPPDSDFDRLAALLCGFSEQFAIVRHLPAVISSEPGLKIYRIRDVF